MTCRRLFAIGLLLASGCATRAPSPAPAAAAEAAEPREAAPAPEMAPVPASVEVPGPLDIETAVAIALRRDARLETLRAAVDAASAGRRAINAPENPEARLSYGETDAAETTGDIASRDSESYQAALRIFPPSPWRARGAADGADARVQAADALLRAGERLVTIEVRRLYRELQYLDRDLGIVNRLVDVRRAQEQALKELANQNQATMQDVLAAGLKYLEAVSLQGEVRRAKRAATRALANLLGAGDASDFKLADAGFGSPRVDPSSLNPSALESLALDSRPDLDAALWEARAVHGDYRAARGLRIPWFSFVQAGYSEQSGERDRQQWSAQVGVELPFFQDPQQGTAVRWAIYRQQRALYEEVRQIAVAEVRDALDALRDAAEQLGRHEQSSRPMLESLRKSLEEIRSQPDLGPRTTAQIEEGIIDGERSILAAQHAYEQALVRLEEVLGTGLPAAPPGAAEP